MIDESEREHIDMCCMLLFQVDVFCVANYTRCVSVLMSSSVLADENKM